jgi:hypothetical protein
VNPFVYYHLKPDGADMGYKVEPGFKDLPFHTWWIKSEAGGVHIWARQAKLEGFASEWIGGVEVHYAKAPDGGWFDPEQPSQAPCWLLDGRPCWHDGSSLYFSERIAPSLPYPEAAQANDYDRMPHSLIGYMLVDWFNDKITGEA